MGAVKIMASFGKTSSDRLDGCHPDLQKIMNIVVKVRDISIIEGIRGEEDQNRMFDEGKSKLQWPDSKHNIRDDRIVSHAVDIAPWPEQYADKEAMIYVAGIVMGVASELGIKLRWGGDWDGDGDMADQSFDDLWHFELVD